MFVKPGSRPAGCPLTFTRHGLSVCIEGDAIAGLAPVAFGNHWPRTARGDLPTGTAGRREHGSGMKKPGAGGESAPRPQRSIRAPPSRLTVPSPRAAVRAG